MSPGSPAASPVRSPGEAGGEECVKTALKATPEERGELRRRAVAVRLSTLWKLLRQAALDWYSDGAPRMGASISFYTIFALSPLVLLVIAIAGAVFGQEAVRGEIKRQFAGLIGPQGAEVAETVIANAQDPNQGGAFGTVMGVVFLVIGATGVFAELKESLNRIWAVEVKPSESTWLNDAWLLVKTRILSFTMVVVIAFLLMVSLLVSAALSGLYEWVNARFEVPPIWLQIVNQLFSLGAFSALFALVFKALPDVDIGWREVLLGGLVTAVLFTIGKYLIGLYLGRSSFASVYGAAGSLVVVLIWIYYSAQIFLFGAELTQVHAAMAGQKVSPAPYAKPVDVVKEVEKVVETKAVAQDATVVVEEHGDRAHVEVLRPGEAARAARNDPEGPKEETRVDGAPVPKPGS